MSKKIFVCYDHEKDVAYFNILKSWLSGDDFTIVTGCSVSEAMVSSRALTSRVAMLEQKLHNVSAFILIVTENARNLSMQMLWEVNVALNKDVPIIAMNINGLRYIDENNCPTLLKNKHVLHIANNSKVLEKALEIWPTYYKEHKKEAGQGARFFKDEFYRSLGID